MTAVSPTEVPPRLASALAHHYRIERPLGAGGMATVYLAEDLKHSRKVAIKVLKPELAAVLGAERFLTEIKTTANLQHPHILPLFDSGEADTYLYYVMPFIDGESLRDRLDREKQLPVEEAVRITRDVADALDYAHRHGVIHRDIKPANILLHDGRPLVADFGIALAISAAGGGRLTETGLSLGTPHYMSPEQASAERDLSARSDVYSLGCVLYEMLAGEPPHTGPNAAAILMRILTEQPRDISDLRATVPLHVAGAVSRAVEKLPADRFETAREFRQALEDPTFRFTRTTMAAAAAPVVPAHAGRGWDSRSRVLAASTLLLAAVVAWLAMRRPAPAVENEGVIAFQLADSVPAALFPVAGPHGWLAWVSRGRLFARPPGSLEPTRPAGDEALSDLPDFSPDGEAIVYPQRAGSNTLLRRTPSRGGNPITILSHPAQLLSPHWGDDGWIYFTSGAGGNWAVVRVPENGGSPDTLLGPLITVPYIYSKIPGRNRLLMGMYSGAFTNPSVMAFDLGTRDTTTIAPGGMQPEWSPTGHVLFGRNEGSLFAVAFDPDAMRATGSPVPVLDSLAEAYPVSRYSLSPTGTLVYVAGRTTGGGTGATYALQLSGIDGGSERIPLPPSDHWDAKISPDGRRLAYIRNDHVWIYDLDLGTHTQLTRSGARHHNPAWSPDGERIVFSGAVDGKADLDVFVTGTSGQTPVERFGGSPENDYPSQWLADGTVLVHTQGSDGENIHLLRPGTDTSEALLRADWVERTPRVSPDGRWIAYVSNEGGPSHVDVRRWPGLANRVQVSDDDTGIPQSSFPLWSRDSRTLYYHQGGRLMAAAVDGSGETLRVTNRRVIAENARGILADLHPDGRRLLFLADATASDTLTARAPRRLVVVMNWREALRERLGADRH
ncbi:MAG TPA: protein kinase [Gemmatimonadaceae bacterium]|nr:protein kinase [Gemmatimonadaceae bacterium]